MRSVIILAQVLTIVAVRPASLTAFFKKQQALQGTAQAQACEVPRLLGNALPWVLHSLQTHTGNPTFPPSCLEWLVLSCVAAAVKCAEATTGTFDHIHNVYVCQKCCSYYSTVTVAMGYVVVCNHLPRPPHKSSEASYRNMLHCEHMSHRLKVVLGGCLQHFNSAQMVMCCRR